MIFFVDSGFNIKETILNGILLFFYPVIALFGFIFSLFFKYIFCPINGMLSNAGKHMGLIGTVVGGAVGFLLAPITGGLSLLLLPAGAVAGDYLGNHVKIPLNSYCGSGNAQACAQNPNTGRLLNLSTWVCPRQPGTSSKRGCTFGCTVPAVPSSWTNPIQYVNIYGP